MSHNPFKVFYDTQIKLVKITTGSGYSDRGNKITEELADIMCDFQCYNGGLAEKEYGLSIKCQYRIFTDTNEHICEGNYALVGGKLYKIIYKAKWKYGDMAILQLKE